MPALTTPLTLVLVLAVGLTTSTTGCGVVVVGFAPPPTFSDRGRWLLPRLGGEGSTRTTSPFRVPAGTLGYSTAHYGTGANEGDEFNGRPSPDHVGTSVGVGGDHDDAASATTAMSTNHLMHAMIRVKNVNETVDYWRDRWGANVNHYRRTKRGETAFVGFGDGSPNDGFFSLEITSLPPGETPMPGDAVLYLGLSMLLDFDFDLRSAAAGEKGRRRTTSGERDVHAVEPNGLEVRSVASGPGDPLARLCLRTTPDKLAETAEFYTDVLGMEQVAVDGRCVCLRYTHDGGGGGSRGEDEDEGGGAGKKRRGVPTTLVFAVDEERGEREVDHGNCFDHVALSTADVEAANDAIRSRVDADSIYMEPTPMFGTVVMGVKDPNGYKMVLVQRKE